MKGEFMVVEMRDTITIAEAARKTGLTSNGLRHWIFKGEIEIVQTPLGRLVVAKSFDAFLEKRQAKKERDDG